jgi:predicted DCC family thiol-disulfide oxidoreductase YuxK
MAPERTAPGPAQARPARREPLRGLTVLYDPDCRVCAFAGAWLAGQRKLIPLRLVPVGSEQARRLFPALDHDGATRREITAVGDAGQVYVGDSAWVVCLWALADHRALAHAMSTAGGRRLARAAMLGVAKYRDAQGPHRAGGVPSHPAGRVPGRTPPRGAPVAGRHPQKPPHHAEPRHGGEPPRTAWVYDGAGGWTVRGPEVPRPAEPGGCAEGCAPPGAASP